MDICQDNYFDNKVRIVDFLNKAKNLKLNSKWHWAAPKDMAGINASLYTGLVVALRKIKELWGKLEDESKARRITHPQDCTMTARKILAHFYAYQIGLAEVIAYVGACQLLAIKFERYGNAKFLQFWKK